MNPITMILDRNLDTPLFEQIYNHIKSEILEGNLTYNIKLPSKRQFANHLNCSTNTIEAAYNQLLLEGYIISRERSGYYISKLDGIISINKKEKLNTYQEVISPRYKYSFSYHGVDLDSFPFKVWRKITKEAINEYDYDLLKTGHPQGLKSLRENIANYIRFSRGVNCGPEQIIISSGTEFLLQLLIQLFPSDCVFGLENPGYERLSLLFQSNNKDYIPLTLDKHGIIPANLENSSANIICITPSHQFPTGITMPINRRIKLLQWTSDKDNRYIIEDDYDSEFKYNTKPIPSLQGLDNNGKVIYIGSFSKSLTPAIRISYMVLPLNLLEEYKKKLSFYICPVPTLEQKCLEQFISEGHFERHLNRMRNIYKNKREILVNAIKKELANAKILGENAGLHIILEPNNGISEYDLVERAKEKGVKVSSVSSYYLDKTRCLKSCHNEPILEKPQLLLGFASLREEEIPLAIQLLKKAWSSR